MENQVFETCQNLPGNGTQDALGRALKGLNRRLVAFSNSAAAAAFVWGLTVLPAQAQISETIQNTLQERLPAAAADSSESMTTLVQFLLWVLAVVLVALCGFGVVEGINGRGWNKAFASVVGSVSIAILIAVVFQATS